MDVAKHAGVDYSTVSLALRGDKRIRETTRQKVEQSARELDYRPNRMARSLSGGSSKVIGVMFTEMSQFFSTPLEILHTTFDRAGYSLSVHFSAWNQDRERQGLLSLCDSQVDGIIWAPTQWSGDNFVAMNQILENNRTPYVVLGLVDDECPVTCNQVGGVHEEPLRLALSYLQDLGHCDIALATATQMSGPMGDMHRMRLQSLKKIFDRQDLVLASENILETQDHDHGGLEIALKLCQRPREQWPSAIVAADDMLARGLAKGLQALGVNIPKDISVIGFDVVQRVLDETTTLTSVSFETEEATRRAANILRDSLKDKEAKASYQKVIVAPRFIPGNTCAPCSVSVR